MAYQMTAADRRELARLRTEERMAKNQQVRDLLSQYQQNPQVQQQTQQAVENADQAVEDASFLKRAYATTRDIDDQVFLGTAKALEGLVDIGIGVVGAIGGIFDEDFKEQMKRNIEHDFTYNTFESKPIVREAQEISYLEGNVIGGIVRDTARAVGGMLPSVAVSAATGNPALGIAMMSSGAAGNATEEAYKDGAGFYQGLGYGVAEGAKEAATEMLFGGLTSNVFGKGVAGAAKSAGKEVAETGVKRIVKGMAEEAAEEAIAEAVSPLTKTIYKGTDALTEYTDPEFYKGVGRSALIGATAGGAMGGLSGNLSRNADVQASMESLQKLAEMEAEYHSKDLLTDEVKGKIKQSREANLENLQNTLQKMSASKRADAIASYGLSNVFAENGKITPEGRAMVLREQLTTEAENGAQSESVGLDERYVAPSVWNNSKAIKEDLKTIKDSYESQTNEKVADLEVLDRDMTDTEKTAYKQFKRVMSAINKKNTSNKGLNVGLNFVVLKESSALSGAILRKGNTLYITADRFADGSWAKTTVHESLHFAEGSKQYATLMRFLAKDKAAVARAIDAITGEGSRYGFTAEEVEAMVDKNGKDLTERERTIYNELSAHLAEEVLGNEKFIERIVRQDKPLAERILSRIKELAEAFRSLGNKEARAEYKRLKQAEKLFMQAIENAGYKYVDGKIEELTKKAEGESTHKITANMSDEERYNVLKDKSISLSAHANLDKLAEAEKKLNFNANALDFSTYGDRSRLFKKLGDEFSVYQNYKNSDIALTFSFGKGKMQESTNKQKKKYADFAKMFTCFDEIVDNAIGIEVHNRNEEGYKKDNSLKNVYVLASAFTDGDNIIPVKLEVKEFSDKQNTLHVAIALESIKKDRIVKQEVTKNGVAQQYSPLSTISIAEYFQNVNPSDESFYKYIPKPFLEEKAQFSLKKTTSKKESPNDNAQTDSGMELAEETMRRRNFGDLDGVTLRKKANQENEKVYTKKDASEIVSEVLSEHMSFGEVYGTLRGKSREDVVDMLWRGLNAAEEGKRAGVALDVAEYIIRSAAVEDAVDDPANEMHRETLDLLKQYVRKLDLSGIRAEINHKYDKKSARIYSRWGKRKDAKGLPPDVAAMELQELGFQIEATHPADILFEIEDAYQKASDALNTQAKAYLRDTMTNEEFKQKQQEIARDILKGFEEKGSKSRLAKTVNDYAERIANLKKELGEQRGRNSLENRVLDRLKKTKDLKLGTYHRSSEFNDARFRGSIERLASIQSRGVLREKKTREIFKELLSWYTAKNELLQGGQFSQEVYDMMEQIANGDGNLTNDDLRLMIKVVDYFNHFVETFNKVYRSGKYVDAEPLVKRYIKSIDKAKDTKISILRKWFESGYYQAFGDPLTLMRYADKYDPNGYYTELFLEFRRGAVGTATTQMQLMESYNQFFKNHKGYEKRLTEETLEYQGKKIPVDEAISLYMTTKRKQAWKAIVKSGVMIELGGKRVRFNPVLEGENVLTETELKAYADYVGKEIYRQLSETDRDFVGIMESVMNNHCAILKRNTDMQRLGYTNVEAGAYYYPIVRAQIAKNLDSESFYDAMDHVSNLSINKNLVEGAQGELLIRPASAIFTRHVRQVSMYANLANALDNFNCLFNLSISDNPGKPITIQSQTSAVEFYRQMNEYVQKLVKDIQGLPVGATDQKWYNDKVRFVRSGFAKYQLGANPKVWVTQFSSFFAAQNILDFDSIVKGFSVKNKASDVDKYCLLAKLRNEENTVVRAQSVVDKTGKIGDILMKPIGMMDRFVVTSLFGACQVQVEKNGGAKVGTDQNMSEAAELLERVILETQQNALATERSGAMRSGDELLKSLTMFSADSMKVFGRFMDAAGELLTLKQNIKSNRLNNAEKATLEKRIQGARKQLMKSTATMVASAAFMALVGLMFRWLYRKDEDKDASEVAADVALDSIGNLIGGLPILRDVYSLFADGYELDNFLLTTLNDVVNATKSTVDLALDAATGKPVTSQEVASAIRKMVYSAGQIFGIPVRNAYNVVSGLIKRISPSTGYQIENIFYQQSYNSDLAKAIENDDERMISTIAGLIIDEKVGSEDAATRAVLKDLTAQGYKVLPRSIGKTITYNEEEIELTKEQQNRFRTVYAASDTAVADLVKLDTFKNASAEEQAKAVRFIYDTYYNLARDDMLGVDSEQKNVLFAEAIPIEKLAIIAAVARSMEADKDKSGKAISGSKKAKVTNYVSKLTLTAAEKYMIMGYLGYTNVNGESQVNSYINRLNLSNSEKQLLLEYSGYKSNFKIDSLNLSASEKATLNSMIKNPDKYKNSEIKSFVESLSISETDKKLLKNTLI